MSDIFREVDEEVRRDRAAEIWKQHGTKILAFAFAIVAGVGGWRAYETWSFRERAALGTRYEQAIAEASAGKPEALASLTALAEAKAGAYSQLARFRLAGELAAKATDDAARANAVSAFEALANDAAMPGEWRDLARLRAAYVRIDHAPLAEIESRLQPLAAPGAPFRHQAREGLALAAWRNGDMTKAMDAVQAIILDADSPAGLRQRAELLLSVIRAGRVEPKAG